MTVFFILDDDINLNSRVFHWLNDIKKVFESSKNMLTDKRIQVEKALMERYDVNFFSLSIFKEKENLNMSRREIISKKENLEGT